MNRLILSSAKKALLILSTILLAFTLYHLKYKVSGMEKNLRIVKAKIAQERESIHILRAEWEYLNNPSRLQQLNEKFLHLNPVRTPRIITADKLTPSSSVQGVKGVRS